MMYRILVLFVATLSLCLNPQELSAKLSQFVKNNSLMGLAVQITKSSNTIYRDNFGHRDIARNLPVDNSTAFRVASLSKNVAAVGLHLLVQQGKLGLKDPLSSLVGFNISNPYFPTNTLTVEMLLSHQSSIEDCNTVYDGFLASTELASDASSLPNIKDLFTPGSRFYNNCSFNNNTPGTHYSYSNLGYILVGVIIEKVTNTRFDKWIYNNYLNKIGSPSYNPADLPNINNLAVLYQGLNAMWVPSHDNYQGSYTEKNLTSYTPGQNPAIFAPHANLRATTDQLLKHINLLRVGGGGVLKADTVAEIVRPRYQYHGEKYGSMNDFHAYGSGLYTTSYYSNDRVLESRVTVGHTGSGYGLISGYYYSGEYAFAMVVNGILHGFKYSGDTIYQVQRRDIYRLIDEFIKTN